MISKSTTVYVFNTSLIAVLLLSSLHTLATGTATVPRRKNHNVETLNQTQVAWGWSGRIFSFDLRPLKIIKYGSIYRKTIYHSIRSIFIILVWSYRASKVGAYPWGRIAFLTAYGRLMP